MKDVGFFCPKMKKGVCAFWPLRSVLNRRYPSKSESAKRGDDPLTFLSRPSFKIHPSTTIAATAIHVCIDNKEPFLILLFCLMTFNGLLFFSIEICLY